MREACRPKSQTTSKPMFASRKPEVSRETMQSTDAACPQSPALLRLPIELRRQIYSLVLPHTTTFDVRLQRSIDAPPKSEYNLTFVRQKNGDGGWRMQRTLPRTERETGNDIVWRRGSTNLLAVSRQVHEETADMLYGDNTFVVDVTFNAINFRYRWRTANNLTPNQTGICCVSRITL
ncbi:hypothetical protein DDE82_003071 [Stemphylium lycopersici]|nr:hypothetical protein DDE82_003071 [Stemphylium lycopersici]